MKKKILIIDNYDSFTYNLVQYFGELGAQIEVYRNDKISVNMVKIILPDYIVISPGPCTPREAGVSNEIIKNFYKTIPILGVCLGHQCLAYVFGGKIIHAKRLMHGKTSMIYHTKNTIFKNIKSPFEATRYHSLIVERKTLPKCFNLIAWTKDKEIMAIRLKNYQVWGVQFHPESILTKAGMAILRNFLIN
ncbi:MAG: aminodeoxychorismate/anthranilate synthase component II [Candidatus Omnitrophota bacterium]